MILSWRKECVKCLGVLIDSKLSWTHHITYISTKISKSLGILERLRHFVPSSTLLNIYRSLVQPYLSYGIAWYSRLGPSSRLLPQIWRKFWFFKNVPFDWFISNPLGSTLYLCSILLLNLLYFKTICIIMHDVSNKVTPPNVSNLFAYSSKVHHHNTRFSAAGNFYNFFLFLLASISYRLLCG